MPPPRLVLGSPAALEAALAAEVRAWKERDPLAPPAILTGTQLLGSYLRRRLAHAAGGHLNLRTLTPRGLARTLGEPEAARRGLRPLPASGARVLAEEVAAASGSGYFAPVAGAPGFARSLRRLFDELRQAGVRPDTFRAAGAPHVSPEKHAALAALYEAYESRRAAFYLPDDCYALADPARLDAPCLLVYGVWQPTAALRALLERLMERVPVAVFLPAAGGDADAVHAEMRAWLAGLGAVEEAAPDGDAPATALAHVQAHLFGPPAPAPALPVPEGPADGTVSLLSAPDPVREVREAARACLRWARDGVAFHEMAVVYRHADQYRALVAEVFAEAGIPVYLHGGRPLADHPLGRRVLALLRLTGSRLGRAAVMEFLTETVLPPAVHQRHGGEARRVEPAAWDALSREAGIVEGRAQWSSRLRLLAEVRRRERFGADEEPDEQLRAQLDEIGRLSAFIDELAGRLEAHPRRGPWAEHLAYLRGLVEAYVDGGAAVLDGLDYLAQLDQVAPDVPFARFQDAVRAALEDVPAERVLGDGDAPRGLFGRHGVNVLDVNSLRHVRFRAVAVLGLAERAFPPPPRQDALLLDRERAALNRARGWSLPLRALGPDAEPLQFALAVGAAAERLHLSYPRSEAGTGRPRLPSHFFRAVASALTGRDVPAADVDRLAGHGFFTRVPAGRFGPGAPEDALTPGEYDRALLEDRGRSPIAAAYLAQVHPPFGRARAAWEARWQDGRLTPYDGVLGRAAAAALGRRVGAWRATSPSRLETYATCPYRFFLQYVLRLEPVEEPEALERLDALERGSLIHRILERFLAECGPSDPPAPERRSAHLERLLAIAGEECAEREARGLVGYPLLWQFDRKVILEDLAAWYDREAEEGRAHGLRPGAFELRFGPAWGADTGSPLSSDDPLELTVDGAVLRFQGRIDRVDWTPDRAAFRVIDYKTGGVSEDHRDDSLRGGRALQLPVYLLAAARTLGIPYERGEAQYYYATRRGGFKRVSFGGAALRARWDEFAGLLRALAGSMEAGDFHPVPGDRAKHCTHCDYHDVCDVRVVRLAARKSGDPRAGAFQALAEVD